MKAFKNKLVLTYNYMCARMRAHTHIHKEPESSINKCQETALAACTHDIRGKQIKRIKQIFAKITSL